MYESRTSDLAIILGHALQCDACRQRLLNDPERVLVGRKLSEEQRERLLALTPEQFENSLTLAEAMEMEPAELMEGFNHPRARLRHL